MRLFVLDDAAVLRTLVASVARDVGHEVVGSAATLADALDFLAAIDRRGVDVVLVDSRIPGGDAGIAEITRALVSAAPDAAILTFAALDERESIRRSRETGAAGALLRPITHSGLVAALAGIDARRRRPQTT